MSSWVCPAPRHLNRSVLRGCGKHLIYLTEKTMESFDKFVLAIEQNNIFEIERIILDGFALNEPDEDGAPVLYAAIMHGNLEIVRLLLERGADSNFVAEEPAATVYDEKPLSLAQGLRFIMNWEKYHPIAKLLVEFGATDSEERTDFSEDDLSVTEKRSKAMASDELC